MEKIKAGIKTEFITFANLMKFAGVLQTGGQAFELLEQGLVTLNGNKITEKRKKIYPGDTVVVKDCCEIKVETED
ncbi:MAG: RNA-binding S4 domain-containing protein [Acholeplasmataceae bacterium]|nr:RNA-binding S4 domain-containing protein [Acholeplasmataceae bacterium]